VAAVVAAREGDELVYIDPGLDGPERMIVEPDKLLQLKQGIEEERDRVAEWLINNGLRLRTIKSPGEDPCSVDAMDIMGQNGHTALKKGDAYVARLASMITKMHESALTYDRVEDETARTFRQGPA
jgi:hypothetical protein